MRFHDQQNLKAMVKSRPSGLGILLTVLLAALFLALPTIGMAQSHSATLTWTASERSTAAGSKPVAGYTPMRGTEPGGPYTPLVSVLVTKTTYADTTVEEGQTYYYVVTATDTAGSVSSYSNEVSVQIPGGPIMISPTAPPGGTVGASYSAKLSITGGTPPYNCTWKGLAAGIASDSCALSGTPTSMGKYSVGVTVTDSAIPPRSATASFPVEIELPSDGFWSDKTTPANITGNDSQSVEVGLRFKSSIAGAVKAIRFYRATNSAETNIVHLWGPSGKSLATADAPAGPGWITVPLTHPVPITPGKTYTASYHTLQYAWNSDFFSAPLVSGPLTAPVNAGVYRYGSKSAFPSSIYQASNYWVDVVFVAEGKAAAASR